MKLSLVLLLVAGLVASTYAQSSCDAMVTATARSGSSWSVGITQYQIFDIKVVNRGSCPLTRIVGFFSAGAGFISEAWNYDSSSGLITGFGSSLPVGQSFFGAGFVLANSSQPTLALSRPGCSDSCQGTTAPTNSPSTSAPSTSAPSTATPSTATPSTSAPSTSSPSTCHAMITVNARQGSSWTIGETRYQLYDMAITNQGSCPLTRIVGFFSVGAGFISEAWNYNAQTGLVSGYGDYLAAGQSFNGAGFVLANSTAQPTLTLTRPGCPDSCYSGSTSSPSTSVPSTSVPSTSVPSTSSPSTSSPSTSAPARCTVTAMLTRDSYSWMDSQGRNTSVYHLTISNAGPCALKDYAISFAYYPGALISYWSLEPTTGGYLVKGYGDTLAAGTSFSGAGVILAGAPNNVAVTPYGSNCMC